MTRRRRQPAIAPRLRARLRLLLTFVLALFINQATLAFTSPCSLADECSEACPSEHDEKDCPCPLDCAPGCPGTVMRATLPSAIDIEPLLLAFTELPDLLPEQAPPSAVFREIQHVPKHARA
jgi:hypothetical protein